MIIVVLVALWINVVIAIYSVQRRYSGLAMRVLVASLGAELEGG
jgi:hypothetical protein